MESAKKIREFSVILASIHPVTFRFGVQGMIIVIANVSYNLFVSIKFDACIGKWTDLVPSCDCKFNKSCCTCRDCHCCDCNFGNPFKCENCFACDCGPCDLSIC